MKRKPVDRLADECWMPDPVIEPLANKIADLFIAEVRQYCPDRPSIKRDKHMPTFRKAAEICRTNGHEPERFVQTQVAALAQIGKLYPQGLLSGSIAAQQGISFKTSVEDEIALYRAQLALLERAQVVFGRTTALTDPDLSISPALRCWCAAHHGLGHLTAAWEADAADQMRRSTVAAQLFARKVPNVH